MKINYFIQHVLITLLHILPDPLYLPTHPNPCLFMFSLISKQTIPSKRKNNEIKQKIGQNKEANRKMESQRKGTRNAYRHRNTCIAMHRNPLKAQSQKP